MTVVTKSLLEQSEFFLHVWIVQSDIPQDMKTLFCLHFSFVINLLLRFKSHALLWSVMHKTFIN